MACELLGCNVTRLSIDFVSIEKGNAARGELVTMKFNLDLGRHVQDPSQFRLDFKIICSEHTAAKDPQGYQVEATIIGIVRVSDVTEDKMGPTAALNGVAILYGTLRGVIMSATGTFPGGPMVLKTLRTHEILNSIQADKEAWKNLATPSLSGTAQSAQKQKPPRRPIRKH